MDQTPSKISFRASPRLDKSQRRHSRPALQTTLERSARAWRNCAASARRPHARRETGARRPLRAGAACSGSPMAESGSKTSACPPGSRLGATDPDGSRRQSGAFRVRPAIFEAAGLWPIVALSLGVSLSATALATLFGMPLGARLAVSAFPGRRADRHRQRPARPAAGGGRSGALPGPVPCRAARRAEDAVHAGRHGACPGCPGDPDRRGPGSSRGRRSVAGLWRRA